MGVMIFGTGKVANKIEKCIDDDIIGFIDNDKAKWGTTFMGKKVYYPVEGLKEDFASIVIASTKYYKEIYNQLRSEHNVPDEKIFSYVHNNVVCTNFGMGRMRDWSYFHTLVNILAADDEIRILDIGCSCITAGIYHRDDYMLESLSSRVSLCGYNAHNFEIGNIYKNLYESMEEDIPVAHHYQMAFISDADLQFSYSDCCEVIKKVLPNCDEILLSVGNRNTFGLEQSLVDVAFVDRFVLRNGLTIIRVLPLVNKKNVDELKVYVVSHKVFNLPEAIDRKVYVPIYVGENAAGEGAIRDSLFDDNIAELNPWINECTAMYWIWKHSNAQYVGINHYRRYFLHSFGSYPYAGNIVTPSEVIGFFQEGYDIITSRHESKWQENGVYREIEDSVSQEAFKLGYEAIEKALAKFHPKDVSLWHKCMRGINMFPCNMFITSKVRFDQYCQWLFPVLLDSLKDKDFSQFDSYSSRIIGFFAERMLTVWIVKEGLRVKQLPMWVTENII